MAQETGLSPDEANTRVTDTFNKAKTAMDNAANTAKQAADNARKAAAHAALWMFVSLMIGAFIASFAATLGGRRRDLHGDPSNLHRSQAMRSLLLLLLGVPIPIVILIALFVR